MSEPHCPLCGYTKKDAQINMDHSLCKGEIPGYKTHRTESAWSAMPEATEPRGYYGKPDELWTCVFPGKMGISWKRGWNGQGTKAEAESQAAKNCNVVAVPLALWLRYREYETKSVAVEKKVEQLLAACKKAMYHLTAEAEHEWRQSQHWDEAPFHFLFTAIDGAEVRNENQK